MNAHALQRGAAIAIALTIAGCQGASADLGLDADLRVEGAQFVPGAMPEPGGGPEITSLLNPTNTFRPGEVDRPLSGTLAPEATAVAVAIEGDRGYWITPAAPPAVSLPGQPTFDLDLAFAPTLNRPEITLAVVAADGDGRFGPRQQVALPIERLPTPQGELVVLLTWDRDADLDLRVVDPDGVEIWARNPNSAAPAVPGQPPSAEALEAGGAHTGDSNAECAIDGRRQEAVVWSQPPPSGTYTVRVDTFDLCGQSSARWRVEVRRGDQTVAAAEGLSTPTDTRFDHDLGAGVLALEFEE